MCYETKQWMEMEWCLNETAFYQRCYIQRTSEFPIQFLAPYLFNSNLLKVLRMMWMYSTEASKYGDFVRCISTIDSIELTAQQSTIIARLCYNMGVEHFKSNNYTAAIFWLKSSHRYGNYSFFYV